MPASTTESSANGRLWTTTRRGSKTGSLAIRKAITSGAARKAKVMDVEARRTSGNENQSMNCGDSQRAIERGVQQQRRRHGQRQHALARPGLVPVPVPAGVVLDERKRAQGQGDRLEPEHARAGIGLDRPVPEEPQHRRGGVGEHDEPEPEAARRTGPAPAGPREDGHEVQEGRRVPADERAVEVQVRAEERADVALRVAEQVPHDRRPPGAWRTRGRSRPRSGRGAARPAGRPRAGRR